VLANVVAPAHLAVIFLFRGKVEGAQVFALIIIQPFDV
jgi:hypothetical protein